MKRWTDRRFVLTVIAIGVIAKIIIVIAYYHLWLLPGNQDLIGPDGEGFIQRGWYIAKVLSNKVDYEVPSNELVFKIFYRVVDYYGGKLPPFNSRANDLFTYFIGFIFYLFGYIPLLIKFFNILISALSAFLIYRLALKIYQDRIARMALVLFTFFPSIFMFSISALRDPLIILCILSIIYVLVGLNRRYSIWNLIMLEAGLLFVLFLRPELFVLMSLMTVFIFIVNKKMKFKITFIMSIIAVLIFAASTHLFYKINFKPEFALRNAGAVIFAKNAALYHTGGNLAYRIFPDVQYDLYKKCNSMKEYLESPDRITTLEVLRALPKAVFFYFTRPVPFVRPGFAYDLISVNMIFWYLTLALSGAGLFRQRSGTVYPIIIYIVVIAAVTSMAEANEGILLRHRDIVAPFFILFAAAGIDKITEITGLKKTCAV